MKRQCTKCGLRKSVAAFRKYKRSKDGLRTQCKCCEYSMVNRQNETGRVRRWRKRKRLAALAFYSGQTPKCECCGESHIEFLEFDHINGNGSKHRREIKNRNLGAWLVQNGFPEGFRVLCTNCNVCLWRYKYCPHQKKTVEEVS